MTTWFEGATILRSLLPLEEKLAKHEIKQHQRGNLIGSRKPSDLHFELGTIFGGWGESVYHKKVNKKGNKKVKEGRIPSGRPDFLQKRKLCNRKN